jgi:FtsP/CotA-like multicopper oxidase with cupredoxin domain
LAASSQEVIRKFKLEIGPVHVNLAPGIAVQTTGYNGQAPGPLLRMPEDEPVEIEVTNHSQNEELVHWHGLHIPSRMDGAMEEGSPMIAPGQTVRYNFTPSPSGSRWYHTHTMAGRNLEMAAYSGQFGFLYIEPKQEPGRYDQEIFLAARHWEPSFTGMTSSMTGCKEITYRYASFNDKMLGAGDPVRVRKGQRVLFHFLNASPTEDVLLALPGHRFRVTALDGNPVPHPAAVDVLSLAVAERVDAIVEMNSPGKWVLGSVNDADRGKGLGIVIEYESESGKPHWEPPAIADWDYRLFANKPLSVEEPAELITTIFEQKPGDGSETGAWTIDGKSFPDVPALQVREGKRYRLRFINASDCSHPVHLHRHSFELKRVGETHVSGILKDTLNLPRYGVADVELLANRPGPTLFHCHQQYHMDLGFMRMIEYV